MRASPRTWLQRCTSAVLLLALSACLPITVVGGGGGSAPPCPEGTYQVTDQVLSQLVATLGSVELDPLPGGDLTLTVTASGWTLDGSQMFDVTGTTPYGPLAGTASVTVHASGSWTKSSPTQLSFSLGSLTGSGSFTGTVDGNPVTRSLSLDQLGIDDVYGFSGAASYACGSTPDLTLTFSSLRLSLERD